MTLSGGTTGRSVIMSSSRREGLRTLVERGSSVFMIRAVDVKYHIQGVCGYKVVACRIEGIVAQD